MLWFLVALAAVLLIGAFVLAPLVRSETELEPIHRPRPGVRNIRGPTREELDRRESTDQQRLADGAVICPRCGAVVDSEFRYCGQCSQRVR